MASEMSALMNMLEEMMKQNEQQAAEVKRQATEMRENLGQEMKQQAAETRTTLEQTMRGSVADLESALRSGKELVITRLKEQRQAVGQALENQDQRIAAI
nr:unnamed protein product [Callosobruchus chinensis]